MKCRTVQKHRCGILLTAGLSAREGPRTYSTCSCIRSHSLH